MHISKERFDLRERIKGEIIPGFDSLPEFALLLLICRSFPRTQCPRTSLMVEPISAGDLTT